MIGNKLEPFKFWCQKVLPNVYDDSLSYYEYLCKLNEYLNEVIAQINTLTDNMEDYETDLSSQWETYKTDLTTQWTTYRNELSAQWQTYKTYIDNYFDNLDVQNEINNKLDTMASDGTLDNLIQPYVNSEIASQVTAWLNANVDPVGSAVTVDSTLSISGSAADAKVVGDKVKGINSRTDNIYTKLAPSNNIFNKYNSYSYLLGYRIDEDTHTVVIDNNSVLFIAPCDKNKYYYCNCPDLTPSDYDFYDCPIATFEEIPVLNSVAEVFGERNPEYMRANVHSNSSSNYIAFCIVFHTTDVNDVYEEILNNIVIVSNDIIDFYATSYIEPIDDAITLDEIKSTVGTTTDYIFSKLPVVNLYNQYLSFAVKEDLFIDYDTGSVYARAQSALFIAKCSGNGNYYINMPQITPSNYDVDATGCGLYSSLPQNGTTVLKKGSSNIPNIRCNATNDVNAQYIAFSVHFTSSDNIDTKINDFKNMLVCVLGNAYASSYSEPVEVVAPLNKTIISSNKSILASNFGTMFTDYNNAPNNSIYRVGTLSDAQHLSNEPEGPNQYNHLNDSRGHLTGTLITYSNDVNGSLGGETQILITHTLQRNKETSIIAYRNSYMTQSGLVWTEWSQYNPMLTLTGSNTVVRAESASALGLTDLDDFPDNSVYQIDLDCGYDGQGNPILAHDPLPGVSRMLQTVNFSNWGYFGKYQLLVGLGTPTKAFIRYGYMTSVEGVYTPNWCDWCEILDKNTALANNGTLVTGSDLNNLTKNGVYWLSDNEAYTYTNTPTNGLPCVLEVYDFGTRKFQKTTKTDGSIHVRTSSGGTGIWSSWT